jgi:hypothetical protein
LLKDGLYAFDAGPLESRQVRQGYL